MKKPSLVVDELKLVSVAEFAERAGVARDTAYRWCRADRIKTIRLGDRVMIPAGELRRILENGLGPKADEGAAQAS